MPKDFEPDLTEALCDTPLIPESEFMDKMKAIFAPGGVTKKELDEQIAKHPHEKQKPGRKPKVNG